MTSYELQLRWGFLLSAALETPEKLTTEITRADINDIIFFIIFSLLNIMFIEVCSHLNL